MKRKQRRPRAFTLIELLVVVAIIALLLAILLPNLASAREQGRRAKCLSNMKNIASSSFLYAAEDSKNLGIPIHQAVFANQWGFGNYLWWRLGASTSFGGRTGKNLYGTNAFGFAQYFDPNGPWCARTRPLNRYMLKDITEADQERGALEMFACPSDDGLPANPKWVPDLQVANHAAITGETYEKRFFDLFGNSYRYNTIGLIWLSGQTVYGSFTSSVLGSKLDRIDKGTGRVVMYSEPLFYMMTVPQQNLNPDLGPIKGQHGALMTENATYIDGSGRSTRVGPLARFNTQLLDEMDYYSSNPGDADTFLRRGTTWQTDAYPTAGSIIRAFTDEADVTQVAVPVGGWPGNKCQDNLRREF